MYALFNGEYARATMDIDLLAQRIPNDAEEMKKVFVVLSGGLRMEMKKSRKYS